jgi:hypothetical protein
MSPLGHPHDCGCFCCVYETEAAACIEAGLLDPWDFALGLVLILARIVNDHNSAKERGRRAEFFARLLYDAAALPPQHGPSDEVGKASSRLN